MEFPGLVFDENGSPPLLPGDEEARGAAAAAAAAPEWISVLSSRRIDCS
jgi:hypothetical protein